MKELVATNNKSSAKLSWKRKEALQIASSIRQYFADKGMDLPQAYSSLFGRGFKIADTTKHAAVRSVIRQAQDLFPEDVANQEVRNALADQELRDMKREHQLANERRAIRFFTDRETGECFYDDYVELAKAYYTLKNNMAGVYALFKHEKNDHYLKQLVTMCCSRHRLDPVWNYKKSKLIRGLWHRYLQSSRVHEHYQPMHLMLTVPHGKGQWMGKEFYAREFIEKFNLLRKYSGWKRLMYGGEYGIEVTRSGKDGLHIHLHSLVFQRKEFSRDLANRYIRKAWNKLTGATVTWYETLYVHQKDANGKYILDASEGGVPVLDRRGNYSLDQNLNIYDIETQGIRGKRKKFYLDEREEWFRDLTPEQKLKHYCDGVMECIKYHFKTDCFKNKDGKSWDVELMREVLANSKNLRMYSKFGAFYREKALNYSRLEKEPKLEDDQTALLAEQIDPESDGVEGRVNNPYTGELATAGTYVVALALPQLMLHARDKKGSVVAPITGRDHEIYFKIVPRLAIRKVVRAIMRGSPGDYREILTQDDFKRFDEYGWNAPAGKLIYEESEV